MLEKILYFDKTLFHLIHNEWTSSFLDFIMPILTDLNNMWWFKCLFIVILGIWLFLGRKKSLKHLLALVLVVGTTDIISHRVIKASVERPRPRHHKDLTVTLKTHPHAGWSFTSNHAANNFAAATYLTWAYPPLWPIYIVATIIAYSRTYVGVHFPLDITGGALLGFSWTLILIFFLRKTPWYTKKQTSK